MKLQSVSIAMSQPFRLNVIESIQINFYLIVRRPSGDELAGPQAKLHPMNGAKDPSRMNPALFCSSEIHFRAGEVGQTAVLDQLPNTLLLP
jgi:hypothetical protein